MDTSAFEQVYGAFQDFHAYFGPLFGRREARDHSRHYLQALLVQSGERRNAENLSETVPASARVMQRFLTEARWSDDTVIGRLQEYLSPRLGHPEAVWVLDGSDFPKQGRRSAGVARQYCGRLGKVANCQAGMSPSFRDALAALGMHYVLDVPGSTTVWPLEPAWTSPENHPEYQGSERPRKPKLRDGQRRKMEQRSEELPWDAWREITVAEGSPGPRSYQFSAQRVRPTSKWKPGEIHWAIYRRNQDGSELRYYLSHAPEDTPLEPLAYVGGSRWPLKRSLRRRRATWDWTNTRPGPGRAGTTTWPYACWLEPFS